MTLNVDTIFTNTESSNNEFFEGQADSSVRNKLVIKQADESVTSSVVLQNDDELFMPLEANSYYEFELGLYVTLASADPDIRYKFSVPAGTVGNWFIEADETSYETEFVIRPISEERAVTSSATGTQYYLIKGFIKTSNTAGNLQFQWAQRVSDSDAITVKANSYLKAIKLYTLF